MIQGCEYREALQAVLVSGGVAGNVVPDVATVTLNRRFAPDRTEAEAADEVRALLAPVLEDGDEVDASSTAPRPPRPGLDNPILRALVERHHLAVTAKLGWTDVARFAALGVPACNLGPGDATLAHTADERVDRASLDRAYAVLHAVLTTPPRLSGGSARGVAVEGDGGAGERLAHRAARLGGLGGGDEVVGD